MNFPMQRYNFALNCIFNYLSRQDLCVCSFVNKNWCQNVKTNIWNKPDFITEGTTSLQAFQQFLKVIETIASEQTRSLIQIIDVSQIQESLYETIDENWLLIIIQRCPKLRSLIIRDASFITTTSIRKLCSSLKQPHGFLEHLDLSNSRNITEITLKSLIQNFPELVQITLDNCSGVSDSSISQIIYYCHDLQTINIANSRSCVTDTSIFAIAKFGKQKPRRVNFQSLQKISDNSIIALSNYCKNLVSINLSNCSLITCKALESLLTANKNTLEELIIHNMKSIPILESSFIELLIRCLNLTTFSISLGYIIPTLFVNHFSLGSSSKSPPLYTPKSSGNDARLILDLFEQFQNLQALLLHNVPEHTSTEFLWNLFEICGRRGNCTLKDVKIYRTSYESDFILGGYAKVKQNGEINQESVNNFNKNHSNGPNIKLLLLEE
ncbi:RNI-like protein [Gigaspora margarita]|uniref:RNI-like protein n=1 Tax=Gigaspora margarita TaxID=4874 RepID=A0A8H4AS79_GIGMA|nr:RNI-like protein [Gigaspora margarita]